MRRIAVTLILLSLALTTWSISNGSISNGATIMGAASRLPVQAEKDASADDQPISYSRQVLPILQAQCLGCHQPAKQGGDYLMTQFSSLLAGGESEKTAIVPGDPDASYLVQLITPDQGHAEMPLDRDPLSADQIQLIRQWIQQGAADDSPASTVFDNQHPPTYQRPPVITSLAHTPTHPEWLAVNGIHEVVLFDLNQNQVIRRFIGRSPRIETIRFSPDGTRLAVAGGSPGQFGELQIWEVQSGQLLQSVSVTGDVLFGCSWSPDGTKVAFGATDNTVRAVLAESGKHILFQNVAEDWVRDTVFSVDGSHLISVGRDMACKLTEVETERFVDNITSITPGVLKGGISSIARHPERDEILIGSADGIPKLYRVFRETKRVIGDDANLLRKFPAQTGQIQAVDIAPDGSQLVTVSSIDGHSEVRVYDYSFDTTVPEEIKAINSKVASSRSAEENQKLEDWVTSQIQLKRQFSVPDQSLYAVAFTRDQQLVVAGSHGTLWQLETNSEQPPTEVSVFSLQTNDASLATQSSPSLPWVSTDRSQHQQIIQKVNSPVQSLHVYPESIQLKHQTDYVQLVVQAHFEDGTQADVGHQCQMAWEQPLATLTSDLLVQSPTGNGKTSLKVTYAGQSVSVPVDIELASTSTVDFRQDVNPILGKLGCNAGTCHGSQAGKHGFKLSLRGYDPIFDIRALTDELSARRVNIAAPEASLLLLKATAQVPHEGGKLMDADGKYYHQVRQWISQGAQLTDSPRVVSLTMQPSLPVLVDGGQQQQFRVVAHYADGRSRDVTREAFIETANQEVAVVDATGTVTAKRRGEAAILARYEGAFAATTLTIMGQRPDFSWTDIVANNPIDEMVAEKWKRMKIVPSGLCDDYEFLRRVYLDLTGLPPSPEVIHQFIQDERPTVEKRNDMIDSLIGSPAFVDHWTNKWADLLQVNEKFLGAEGANKFHAWIRQQVQDNVPYDQFVRQIVSAQGSNNDNPAAAYYKVLRTPEDVMENTTHLFLATRFNCNKCHDHPFERWTQDQYYATAAYFSQVERTPDPASGDRRIGGTAVEGAKPLFEIIQDSQQGEMIHQRTQQPVAPQFPFDTQFTTESPERRAQFAQWLTRPDNPYFATSYANRLWGYLLGVGLIEPVDDIRASNPPSNPKLLKYLTQELVDHQFDTRHLIRLICQSRTYQLSSQSNPLNQDDQTNYSHALPRRLPAEVLFDTLHQVTGSKTHFSGQPAGTRAAQLADAGNKLPSGLLATLGKPVRESACECERSNDLHLGSVLALVSGPDQANAISDTQNALPELVAQHQQDRDLINQLFLRILNRPASSSEIEVSLEAFQQIQVDHQALQNQVNARLAEVDPAYQQTEQKRQADLKAAQDELAQYLQQHDPGLLQREADQQKTIADLKAQLQQFDADLDRQVRLWRDAHLSELQWHALLPSVVSQSSGAAISVMPDRSIRSENKGKTVTTVIAQTDLNRISALRLEALSADDLPGKGPGLADNGNFVVNQLKLEMETPDAPGQWKPVPLTQALADYQQQNFDISSLLATEVTDRGWAVHPDTGKTHWATFQLQSPLAPSPGTRFRFQLTQNYQDGKHQLGLFRLAFSPSLSPVGLSVSDQGLATLASDPASWDEPTRQQFRKLVQQGAPARLVLQQKLTAAEMPLPVPDEVQNRRQAIAQLQVVTPRDAMLVLLEQDLQRSASQLEKQRLTAAQDLTWALINSPSFLFNH